MGILGLKTIIAKAIIFSVSRALSLSLSLKAFLSFILKKQKKLSINFFKKKKKPKINVLYFITFH